MDRWTNLYPTQIMDINYEAIFNETEERCQRAFDFCNLQWNTDFLQLEGNMAPTANDYIKYGCDLRLVICDRYY